jgi:hypothetical protein
MDEIKKALEPFTDSLPAGIRDFLDQGGWWVVFGVAGLILLLLIWGLADRLLRALFGRRALALNYSDHELQEDLAEYPPINSLAGPRGLTLYHLPARLRLVVAAPSGTEGSVNAKSIGSFLDQVIPGLGAIAEHDRARIRIWPAQMSQQGFALTVRRCIKKPEPEGQPSNWVLAAGRAQVGKHTVLLALALWTEQPTNMGQLTLEPHQWLDVLRIRTDSQ